MNSIDSFRLWVIVVIILLVGSTIFFAWQYISAQEEITQTKTTLTSYQFNEKIITFTKLFVEKVLNTEKEIDFETRLQLENAVRQLNDKQILDQWQRFVNSKTPDEAQVEVKNLLESLINKINP